MEVDREVALSRGIERDVALEGRAEAEHLHRDRYQAGEDLYLTEVDPLGLAETIIDNTTFARPVLVR